jgi:hypothetical protein
LLSSHFRVALLPLYKDSVTFFWIFLRGLTCAMSGQFTPLLPQQTLSQALYWAVVVGATVSVKLQLPPAFRVPQAEAPEITKMSGSVLKSTQLL